MADGELNVDSLITRLLEGERRAAPRESEEGGGRGAAGAGAAPPSGLGGSGRLGGLRWAPAGGPCPTQLLAAVRGRCGGIRRGRERGAAPGRPPVFKDIEKAEKPLRSGSRRRGCPLGEARLRAGGGKVGSSLPGLKSRWGAALGVELCGSGGPAALCLRSVQRCSGLRWVLCGFPSS